jgi:NTE family protein
MGLTIVHKSDFAARKRNPRIALVLAGGAVSGGAYKLGGLKALDDFLVNRKTTDFDIYVGLSAGSVLAAPLAGGITPAEMLRSLEGSSEDFTTLSARDFYGLNVAEFATKPIEFIGDLLAYVPGVVYDFLVQTPKVVRDLEEPLTRVRHRPSLENLLACVKPMIDAIGSAREFPFPLAYLPSGIFSNRNLERYLRRNIERRGLANDFPDAPSEPARRTLHRRDEPGHRGAGRLRARRGLFRDDLRGGPGVDRVAGFL